MILFGTSVYFKKGVEGLGLSCGASSFLLGLWVTELPPSKDSLVPKSLLNPRTQTKSELPPFNPVARSAPHCPGYYLYPLYLMS
jgi:hypothetical protein